MQSNIILKIEKDFWKDGDAGKQCILKRLLKATQRKWPREVYYNTEKCQQQEILWDTQAWVCTNPEHLGASELPPLESLPCAWGQLMAFALTFLLLEAFSVGRTGRFKNKFENFPYSPDTFFPLNCKASIGFFGVMTDSASHLIFCSLYSGKMWVCLEK